MQKIIGICGIDCAGCPAFIATQKDADEERKKVADKWSSEQYPFKPEDINCDGCLAVDKRYCKFVEMCEVRNCGFSKNVENCAHCNEYPCEKIEKRWGKMQASDAKATLEEIRKNL